jgi:hypothetical protein
LSTSARTDQSQRKFSPAAVLAAIVACLAVGGLAAFLAGLDDESPSPVTRPARPRTVASPPEVNHARWRIRHHATGGLGRLTKAQRRRVGAQAPHVAALVKRVFDTLFLDPARGNRVVRASFTRPAARTWLGLRAAGPPRGTSRLALVARRAQLSLDARSATQAVASVRLKARGRIDRRRFRLRHEATLWLERSPGKWRVVAYTVSQRPVRR